MGYREDFPDRFPTPPLADAPAPSVLPGARALGPHVAAPEETGSEPGGRFIPEAVRTYIRWSVTGWHAMAVVFVIAAAIALLARLEVSTRDMVKTQILMVWYVALSGWLFQRARRFARESVRFLQHGVVVVPNIVDDEMSYPYMAGGISHVHVMRAKALENPVVIYDPAQPTEPRIVDDVYPYLIVEADAVRFRNPSKKPPRVAILLCIWLALGLMAGSAIATAFTAG